ncbi:MAG TPA: hypothetical protein VIF35_05660 [Streptosporangiaceae bacterium]|jgi:hypothetical protein
MYQPYPEGGAGPAPQTPERPPSVQNAVRLMYAGAAISLFVIIVAVVTIGSTRTAIHADFPAYSASKVHKAATALVVYEVVIQIITIGLWLWMAAANKAGKSWARIVSTVLFILNTLILLSSLARPHAVLGILLLVLVWLAGLGAIILLWLRDSSAYFAASKSARAQPGR